MIPLHLSDRFKHKLQTARCVVALTGAGVSAESNVPTFRGEEGLWKNFRPEEVATPQAFRRDPKFVWEWYDSRRALLKEIRPNPAHEVLARLEKRYAEFWVVTQNIDGLHQAAGSRNVIELHGNIWKARCVREGTVTEMREAPLPELPPKCRCGALLRPHVVWFGELLPVEEYRQSEELISRCDLLFVVGTSGIVQPAASLPYLARERGGFIVEVNPEETPISAIADEILPGKAGEVLLELEKISII